MGRIRLRTVAGVAVVGTAVAMATVVAVVPSGSAAATPQKEYAASFEAECVVAPGVLNMRGTMGVTMRVHAPESVAAGQAFELTESSVTVTSPAGLGEDFHELNVYELRGHVTKLPLQGTDVTPAEANAGKPSEYPSGLPFFTAIENGAFIDAPALHPGEVGLTYTVGTFKAGTTGEDAVLEVAPQAAFEEATEGGYRATGNGIVFEIEGYNSSAEHEIGPLSVVCTAPSGVVLAQVPIVVGTSTTTTTAPTTITVCLPCELCPRSPWCPPRPSVSRVEPVSGPEAGGTKVTITGSNLQNMHVVFGSSGASTTVVSEHELIAISPPGTGTVPIYVEDDPYWQVSAGTFTYTPGPVKLSYSDRLTEMTLTPKRLGEPIASPQLAYWRFDGSGELEGATGEGFLDGRFTVPAYTASVKLLGALPMQLGIAITQPVLTEGKIKPSTATPGDETLTLPTRVNVAIASVGLLGLKIPTSCQTSSPLTLPLSGEVTREQLLEGGDWTAAGTATLPAFKCQGGLLGALFGPVLTSLLSGPEAAYNLRF